MELSVGAEALTAWHRFFEKLPPAGALPRPIVHRIADGLPPSLGAARRPRPRITDDELQDRCAANAPLIECAAPHLEWAHAALGPTEHVISLVDADGVVLHALGSSPESLQGSDLQPGCDRSEACCGTNGAGTAIRSGQPVAVLEADCGCDRWRTATSVAAPIHGPDGRCVGAIDLTTRACDGSPQALVLVAHLAFTIERDLAVRLRQEDPGDGGMFALLYHDLRTPLSAILLRASLLGIAAGPDARAAAEHVRGIQTAVRSAERMVRNLHDLVAVDAGTLRLRAEPQRLREAVDETLEVVRPMADEGGVFLRVDVPHDLLVLADTERVQRVLGNLIENALKFTEIGGAVDIRARRCAEEVEVVVRDTGCGISPCDLQHIFERGWSGRGSSGLGLWIVHRLVEAHGGHVKVESHVGGGTTVTFTLPAA
jgi:nitrogen-specific signal transduction histidine kinase